MQNALDDLIRRKKTPSEIYWWGSDCFHIDSQVKGISMCGLKQWYPKQYDLEEVKNFWKPIVCKSCHRLSNKYNSNGKI